MFLKMVELKDKHEAMKQEQEKAHSEQLEGLKQHYEISLEGNVVLWWIDLFFMFYLNFKVTDLCYTVLHIFNTLEIFLPSYF